MGRGLSLPMMTMYNNKLIILLYWLLMNQNILFILLFLYWLFLMFSERSMGRGLSLPMITMYNNKLIILLYWLPMNQNILFILLLLYWLFNVFWTSFRKNIDFYYYSLTSLRILTFLIFLKIRSGGYPQDIGYPLDLWIISHP